MALGIIAAIDCSDVSIGDGQVYIAVYVSIFSASELCGNILNALHFHTSLTVDFCLLSGTVRFVDNHGTFGRRLID